MTKADIILIGPPNTGKSTIGKLLADALGVPQVSLDDLRWGYYKEIGYDETLAQEIRQKSGFAAVVWYWKQFDVYAVERILADHQNCVIDFGAGHSIYESAEQMARAQRALAPYPNVVLILPSPDIDESRELLHSRWPFHYDRNHFDFVDYFLRSPSNAALARYVVYTKDRTPEQSCDEILSRLAVLPGVPNG